MSVKALKDEPRVVWCHLTQTVSLCLPSVGKQDEFLLYRSGAPDQLLKRVTRIEVNGEVRPITEEDKKAILANQARLGQTSPSCLDDGS